jgi:hypothetical protein
MFDGLTIAQKLMYLEEHARQGGYTQTAEALRKLQETIASGVAGHGGSFQETDHGAQSQAVSVPARRGEERDR